MQVAFKRQLLFFLLFTVISLTSGALPELGGDYFSGYDGLGRGIYLAIFVTIPSAIIASIFLIQATITLYRQKHKK